MNELDFGTGKCFWHGGLPSWFSCFAQPHWRWRWRRQRINHARHRSGACVRDLLVIYLTPSEPCWMSHSLCLEHSAPLAFYDALPRQGAFGIQHTLNHHLWFRSRPNQKSFCRTQNQILRYPLFFLLQTPQSILVPRCCSCSPLSRIFSDTTTRLLVTLLIIECAIVLLGRLVTSTFGDTVQTF